MIEREQPERKIFEKGRSFFLCDEVDGDVSLQTLLWIGEKENDPKVPEMNLYINSVGGDMWGCLTIAQALRQAEKPVNTIIIGRAYSGAALIAASGDKGRRFAWPTAEMMIHDITVESMAGEAWEIKKYIKEVERYNEMWIGIMAELTGQSVKKIRRDTNGQQKFFSPEEALKYGLIDAIIEPKKRP